MNTKHSDKLFAAAQRVIPGGVNSPVRAFRAVGRNPLFITHARGPHIWDADGNKYIDYVGSWGPMILGHAHPAVTSAIRRQATHGTSYGVPTELEVKLAKLITELMPSVEMVRMVNSGTEATMSAIRLARAFTQRETIIKFEGCYHGHGDPFLIKAGSGAMTLGIPDSPGVPESIARHTLTARFNDLESVRQLVQRSPGHIAAIIVEPIVGNMGCVPPKPGFLDGLRRLCTEHGILLIFDEVMTGFRVALGGAQELYNIKPDLTTLGKIIGGGLPVGAYGGRREIMELIAPSGPVYQAGTLSGNPLAMAAGYATLRRLTGSRTMYNKLESLGRLLEEGIGESFAAAGVPVQVNRVGSMFTAFFTSTDVVDYETAKTSDTKRFAAFFRGMLEQSVYLAPSQFEAAFISAAHSEQTIRRTVRACRVAAQHLRKA